MVERTREIVIDGRTFQLKKLPAAKAYAILTEIITKAMPLDWFGGVIAEYIPMTLSGKGAKQSMTMEELEQLQLKLLSSVSEKLNSGFVAVIDGSGHFQVEDLEEDMMLFGNLLLKVVEFQYGDFFTELLSKLGISLAEPEILQKKLAVSLQNAQM